MPRFFVFPTISLICAVSWATAVAVHGEKLIDLDAREFAEGPLPIWPNAGSLGGEFAKGIDTPSVVTVAGVRGVQLDGDNDWYVGPVAPRSVTGNGSRTVIAWIHNPSPSPEETVFAWGRRGGPAGTSCSLNHGNHPNFGAVAHWDAPDLGWAGAEENGEWTCIAYRYDAVSGLAEVYTNGVRSNSKQVGPLNTFSISRFGQPLPFAIGCQNGANGQRDNDQMPGSFAIAKVRVDDTALSASEIAAEFNRDRASFQRKSARVMEFSADREAVVAGAAVTLSWQVGDDDSVTLGAGIELAEGAESVVVRPLRTTDYTLTIDGPHGTRSETLRVVVDAEIPVARDLTVAVRAGVIADCVLEAEGPGEFAWTILTAPSRGTISGSAPNFVYTPAEGAAGRDALVYRVANAAGASAPATVTFEVNPAATPPIGVSPSNTTIGSGSRAGTLVADLRAEDPNFRETHDYELVAGAGDADNDHFLIVGSQLVLRDDVEGNPGGSQDVRIRVTDSAGMSAEQTLRFKFVEERKPVVINEIHYNPEDNSPTDFIELFNPGAAAVDLSGWSFTSGVKLVFPAGTVIEAGGFAVVVADQQAFEQRYGIAAAAEFDGGLASEGERIDLRDAAGELVDTVDYKPEFPWPVAAGGAGPSMELIDPALDNDLGGSWRSSISKSATAEKVLVAASSDGWQWHDGRAYPAGGTTAWHHADSFGSPGWKAATTPIGYGEVDGMPIATEISGMHNQYLSLFARKSFTIPAGEVPNAVLLRYSQDDGILIWINGRLVERRNVNTNFPNLSTTATNQAYEGLWYSAMLEGGNQYFSEGTNVVAVQLINTTLSSSDIGFDLQLKIPAGGDLARPSPGEKNTVAAEIAAPQIRQVRHDPEQPRGDKTTAIRAKITDPQGVGKVNLLYQVVTPGGFIPATLPRPVSQIMADPDGLRIPNPVFEDPVNWVTIEMRDDGAGADGVAADNEYCAEIPIQLHRSLVRYRIEAEDLNGAAVRVPYEDDPSLNFAYFVYDGVPDYTAAISSADAGGGGKVWPRELLTSVPVYHWLTRGEDLNALQAYNPQDQFPNNGTDSSLAARRVEEWEGAFVYDGIVYDHVYTRLRGGNSRYGDNENRFTYGKRHYKFKFNRGHRFQARDQEGNLYKEKWKSLAFNKMFGNKGGNGWGMPEEIGATLWEAFGVPAPRTHWFHFRVIDGVEEAFDQYRGDFYGIQQVMEEYEGTFLEERGLEKGNLYKMSDWIWDADRQRRYQAPGMVDDGSEFNEIRDFLHGGMSEEWLKERVNYDAWYRYSAVAEAIRHYDVFPYTDDIRHAMKNLAWYFEPVGFDPRRGRCIFMPYDWDASFGPSWNNGWDHANNALYGWDPSTSLGWPYIDKPDMKIEHRNILREFRDLVWQPDQVNRLIDDRARIIGALAMADQDRYRNAPFGVGTANDDSLPSKINDMKNFCFVGWSGASGPTVGARGRGAYLDNLADGPDAGRLPETPVIRYTGEAGYPVDGLAFETDPFRDRQGVQTFAATEWRIGPGLAETVPGTRTELEIEERWKARSTEFGDWNVTVPAGAVKAGQPLRARVRMQDTSGRWSHWSKPLEFLPPVPDELEVLRENLVVSEIMYHPAGPDFPGSNAQEFEFLEFLNIHPTMELDLTEVRITKGVDFDFVGSAITALSPGARVLVVKNLAAFESRYGGGLPVAGEWEFGDNLSNGGEEIKVSYGAGIPIRQFVYDDGPPWPVAADGEGPSLELIDPAANPDHGVAANWRASESASGSPGTGPEVRADGYAAWAAAQGAGDPNDEASPGISYLMMYATGGDLVENPYQNLPSIEVEQINQGEADLILKMRVRIDVSGVSHQLETATVPDQWGPANEVVVPLGDPLVHGDGTHTLRYRMRRAPGDPQRFIRLRVVREP